MNIKDKARKRALCLHCAGPKVQDIFDTLEDTGEDFETVAEKLVEYFEPRKHHLFNIYQFRQLIQEKEESYDVFATPLKQAAGPCNFPTDWRDVDIELQLTEKGKSRRVRRVVTCFHPPNWHFPLSGSHKTFHFSYTKFLCLLKFMFIKV